MAFRPNQYGIRNAYRPTQLAPKPYGWSRAPMYNKGDVPTRWIGGDNNQRWVNDLAYEWLKSNEIESGYANPPFVSGAAGRILPSLKTSDGQSPRILRGYIRRATRNVADEKSKARLYFMYNPEQISRSYLSYLQQDALDPFNSVYGSANLVAPPALLDFSFELFFDRQHEAQNSKHPGVLVDYSFFDMVVRNVNPDPSKNNGLPDNGVMMINPQQITVVFSPELTVQGIPTNASVSFTKFTHRMTPVRMVISLQIRATYFGPLTEQENYLEPSVEVEAEQSVPWWVDNAVNVTVGKIEEYVVASAAAQGGVGAVNDWLSGVGFGQVPGMAVGASSQTAQGALQWAMSNISGSTKYDNGSGRTSLPASADCSGLVWSAYRGINCLQQIGFNTGYADSVESMMNKWTADGWSKCQPLFDLNTPQGQAAFRASGLTTVAPGDLIVRFRKPGISGNHIGFVVGVQGDKILFLDAASRTSTPQVGQRTKTIESIIERNTHVLRPLPGISDSAARYFNQSSAYAPRTGPR